MVDNYLLYHHHQLQNIVFPGLCVMDVFLAGPQVRTCQGGSNHHHPSCHVRPSSSSSSPTPLSPSTFSMPRSSIPTEELFRSTTTSSINSSLPPVAYTKVKNWIIAKKWKSKVSVRLIKNQIIRLHISGNRCVEQHLCLFRLPCPPWVCSCQLRRQGWCQVAPQCFLNQTWLSWTVG